MQIDPDPGRLNVPISVINKYIYALNNPTNLTDPSGESVWTDIRDVLKGIFVGIGTTLAVIFVVPAIAAGVAASAVTALGLGGTGLIAGTVGAIVGAAVGATLGAAVGGVARGILTWMTGGNFAEGFRAGAIQGAVLGGLIGLFQGFQLGNESGSSTSNVGRGPQSSSPSSSNGAGSSRGALRAEQQFHSGTSGVATGEAQGRLTECAIRALTIASGESVATAGCGITPNPPLCIAALGVIYAGPTAAAFYGCYSR